MGVIADSVLANGGRVVGIIPDHLDLREVGHRRRQRAACRRQHACPQAPMFELSDAFAVLPGGMGTLDETFEILTWRQIGLHDKPIVIWSISTATGTR